MCALARKLAPEATDLHLGTRSHHGFVESRRVHLPNKQCPYVLGSVGAPISKGCGAGLAAQENDGVPCDNGEKYFGLVRSPPLKEISPRRALLHLDCSLLCPTPLPMPLCEDRRIQSIWLRPKNADSTPGGGMTREAMQCTLPWGPPAGQVNVANTCYANSVVQARTPAY